MKTFVKIFRYALPYKLYVGLNILFNVISVVFRNLALLLFIPFLQLLMDKTMNVPEDPGVFDFSRQSLEAHFNFWMNQYIDQNNKMDALFFICAVVASMFFITNIFRYLAMFSVAVVRNGVVRDLRNALYQRITELPLGFFSESRKGDIMTRVSNDVQEVEWSILSSLELIFREPVMILVSLASLLLISPELTLFSFILLPVSGLLIGVIGKSLKRSSARVQKKLGLLLSEVEETLSGLRIIKAFNAEKAVIGKFKSINNDLNHTMISMSRKRDLASPLSEFMGSFVMVILAWYGGKLVLGSDGAELDGSHFITYIALFATIINPVKALSTAWSNANKGAASVDRIEAILNAKNEITEKPNAKNISTFTKGIRFNDVRFSYGNTNALTNINLEIPKGKTIALVGESGGGKSTLVDLLPRFYDVSEGSITIDDIDIRDLKIADLRGLMGIVTQESILFNDTVFNNIAFGLDTTMSEEEVIKAAKIANAHEFISQLENGYHTNIGERGGKLSGGQRQRLSIARAVLKNPDFLILDEATSALDTESEKLVQGALENLMKNRTSIVIAHRLSTIQHADEIIVLQSGQIAERGTHTELLKQKGIYHRLVDLQTFV